MSSPGSTSFPSLPWKHPYQQGFAPIGPTKFYYELHGQGPCHVVFLMGLNTNCQAWDYQTTYFGGQGQFTVLTFDARGVGLTDGSWDAYNTDTWAQDLLQVLDHVGWTEHVHAVGYSAGGQVLLKAVLKDPSRFQTATLVCTTAGSLWLRPFTGAYTLVSNMFYANDPLKQISRLIHINYTKNFLQKRPDDGCEYETNYEKVLARIQERNARSRSQSLGGMVSQTVASLRHWVTRKELDTIRTSTMPVMVMTNDWDNFVHVADSYYLRDQLQPENFVIFEDTGHVVPTARHQDFNEQLERFWENHA
ncbi:alpha/beta-hydrolase [Hesseltinella vesiculosa]|uniref:Alpha/beta-hydrolase n=1 Tax=Hesseltinella vesiculosa TaxID=101127 RepID=A0A1X2GE41_9FUNG|nr:alpha/beta-hydrolase [Hesseltinella vesiculosa]